MPNQNRLSHKSTRSQIDSMRVRCHARIEFRKSTVRFDIDSQFYRFNFAFFLILFLQAAFFGPRRACLSRSLRRFPFFIKLPIVKQCRKSGSTCFLRLGIPLDFNGWIKRPATTAWIFLLKLIYINVFL